jgi:hypothetical protein
MHLQKAGGAPNPKFDVEQHTIDLGHALSDPNRLWPNDPVRGDYASWLAWTARYFIFEHEFCHIFNGHLDWINKTTGFKALGEVGASSIPGLSNLDLQTLEADADCYAATHTALTIFRATPEKVFLGSQHLKTYHELDFGQN